MRYARDNDRWPAEGPSPGSADLAPALGTWFNCNRRTGEIPTLTLVARDGELVLRAFGAADPAPIDWGETVAIPHVSGLGSREVSGFTARYDFGFMETHVAANIKYGVLVIQSYNRFRDGSGRPPYFTREFFHQDLAQEPPGDGDGAALPGRRAGDRPAAAAAVPSAGPVDLAPLLGSWRNTYRSSHGLLRVVLSRSGDDYLLHAVGVGSTEDWGRVRVVPHATGVSSRVPAGFLAHYDFGGSALTLAANEAKGLLIIAAYATFEDGSGRSSYFLREFFYREANGLVSP